MKKYHRPVGAGSSARGRDWALVIRLPEPPASNTHLPLYLHISRAISDAITSGRLAPGSRLPGSRTLSQALNVHRNTVLRAFQELLAEGWLETARAKATFVSSKLPEAGAEGTRLQARQRARDVATARGGRDSNLHLPPGPPLAPPPYLPPRPGVYQLFGGLGDLRLLPAAALARAYQRVLRRPQSALTYADPGGNPQLRAELAEMLRRTRGLAVTADDVLVTRGSQMALSLAARSLLVAGDKVAVEQWGYPPAWQALRAHGARLLPVPVDDQGINLPRLQALCERAADTGKPIKALYLTPHHQYPTTVSLSPGRRLALMNLAAEHRFVILEDDYDHEFHYDGQPLLPLASAGFETEVVYLGTLSKVMAPGLRIGYLVASPPIVQRAIAHRFYFDRQGDVVGEAAIAELLEDGELQRHVRRARRHYQERRDRCVELLRGTFGDDLTFSVPCGGMALWLSVVGGPTVTDWHAESFKLGVEFQPGAPFSLRRASDTVLRLGYAALTPSELEVAVDRLKRAWERAIPRRANLV